MLASLDLTLFLALNRGAANPVLDWVMPRITNLHHKGWFMGAAALLCLMVLWKGGRRARVWVLCALIALGCSDLVASRVIKRFAPRPRPCHQVLIGGPMSVPGTRLVGGCPGSSSLPSNHAANMMAVGLVGWWFTRGKGRWLWFLLPLVIGYSRVYLGYHYPSDVVGGWALGGLLAAAALWASRGWLREPEGRAAEPREPAAQS